MSASIVVAVVVWCCPRVMSIRHVKSALAEGSGFMRSAKRLSAARSVEKLFQIAHMCCAKLAGQKLPAVRMTGGRSTRILIISGSAIIMPSAGLRIYA